MNQKLNDMLNELPDGCVIHKTGDLFCYYESEDDFNRVAMMSRQSYSESFEGWIKRLIEFRKTERFKSSRKISS